MLTLVCVKVCIFTVLNMLPYSHITQLIAELLYKHDCVIVPNFGGFVARQQSAHFSKGNSLLQPPTKQLLFNKNLIHQDGLLVSALMESNDASYIEANQQLTDYTDYIQSLLQAKKRFELANIGLLYIDAENALRFEPKADVNFLIESFGFEPVMATELAIEVEKPIEKQFEDRRVVIEHLPVQHKKSYAKIAALAVGIPATLAFLLFAAYSKPMQPLLQSSLNPFYTPEKTYNPINSNYAKAFVIKEVKKQVLLEDINGCATFQLDEGSAILIATTKPFNNEVSTVISKSVLSTKNRKAFEGNYQVVMGCFGVITNAQKLVKDLEKHNVTASVSGTNAKGLHVVSCGGFNTKEEADNLLASIKPNYPKAWIMSK